MTIRPATLDDVPELVAMGVRFRATTDYSTIVAENAEQMAATATGLIEGDSSIVLVADDYGGALVGMLGLASFRHPMSGEPTVGMMFWWSECAGCGLRLFDRGKQWARQQGATKIVGNQPQAEERLVKLYERLGFQRVEVAWQLNLEAA